jgi:hypothetical protein
MNNTSEQLDLAEIRLLETHLTQCARICYAMIGAGVICLFAGVVMLIIGVTGDQVVWFDSGQFKITAGGFGAVTMCTSVAWGFVAYRSRPQIVYTGLDRDLQLGSPGPYRKPRLRAKR